MRLDEQSADQRAALQFVIEPLQMTYPNSDCRVTISNC
jgi:hypothetical protein